MFTFIRDELRFCIVCRTVHMHSVYQVDCLIELAVECWSCGNMYGADEPVRAQTSKGGL